MLKDEDRIFKNLYNDLGWDIDSAIARRRLVTRPKIIFLKEKIGL